MQNIQYENDRPLRELQLFISTLKYRCANAFMRRCFHTDDEYAQVLTLQYLHSQLMKTERTTELITRLLATCSDGSGKMVGPYPMDPEGEPWPTGDPANGAQWQHDQAHHEQSQ